MRAGSAAASFHPTRASTARSLDRCRCFRCTTATLPSTGRSEDGSDVHFVAADDQNRYYHRVENFRPLMGLIRSGSTCAVEGGQSARYGCSPATRPPEACADNRCSTGLHPDYHFQAVRQTPPRDSTASANNANCCRQSVRRHRHHADCQTGCCCPASPYGE